MNAQPPPLAPELVRRIDTYWRAANYLSAGQIYLYDNPLLKKPLTVEHIKPRLLGHWGTTPGLNFIYVHLNRVIKEHHLSVIYITGPGHPVWVSRLRNACASLYRCQAGPIAEVGEDHAPVGGGRPRGTGEFFDEISVGQTMKAVPLDALRVIAPRNRQQPGDRRHAAMKRRVKAGHLRQVRMTLEKCLDQPDLAWQMIRRIRHCAMQFGDNFRRDPRRLRVRHAMDYAVSHGSDRRELLPRFEPVH